MPPEGSTASVLMAECTTAEFWFPGDIWAVGIMLGNMLAGEHLAALDANRDMTKGSQ